MEVEYLINDKYVPEIYFYGIPMVIGYLVHGRYITEHEMDRLLRKHHRRLKLKRLNRRPKKN